MLLETGILHFSSTEHRVHTQFNISLIAIPLVALSACLWTMQPRLTLMTAHRASVIVASNLTRMMEPVIPLLELDWTAPLFPMPKVLMVRMPASVKMAIPGTMTRNPVTKIIPWPLPLELLAEVIYNMNLVIGVAAVAAIVVLVVKKSAVVSASAVGVSNASNSIALQAEKALPHESSSIITWLIPSSLWFCSIKFIKKIVGLLYCCIVVLFAWTCYLIDDWEVLKYFSA